MTILRRMMFWLALRLLDFATEEVVVDTYSVNAPFTTTRIRRLKSTGTIGSLSATLVAKAVGFTLLKPFRSSGKIILLSNPKGDNHFRDLYLEANKPGPKIKIHKVK